MARHNLSARNGTRQDNAGPDRGHKVRHKETSIRNPEWSALARACNGIGNLKRALGLNGNGNGNGRI